DPAYYKHQQKMFLDFMRAGLVERKLGKVNWDPVDRTVLANEQVIDGRGWRSNAIVVQREMPQWYFAITKFSEDLLQALDRLDPCPRKGRLMPRNWIGPPEGPPHPVLPRTPNGRQGGRRGRSPPPPATTRCSAPNSWRSRPIIRSRRPPRPRTPRSPRSSPNADATAPRSSWSTPPRKWVSTPE